MKNAKKILLTRPLHEKIIVSSRPQTKLFCQVCQKESLFFTLDEAVNFFRIGTPEILKRFTTRTRRKVKCSFVKIHSVDNLSGIKERFKICSIRK